MNYLGSSYQISGWVSYLVQKNFRALELSLFLKCVLKTDDRAFTIRGAEDLYRMKITYENV